MDATNLADLYDLPLLDWSHIHARLDDGMPQGTDAGGPNRHTCCLTTINADGSPHVTGIGALWVTARSGSRPVSALERAETSSVSALRA
jgi:hypothetical protein